MVFLKYVDWLSNRYDDKTMNDADNFPLKRPSRASSTRAAERIASSRTSEVTHTVQRESKSKGKRYAVPKRQDESAPPSFPVPALRELRPRIDHKDAFPASLSAPAHVHNGIDTSETASVGPQSSSSPVDEPSASRASSRPQRSRNLPRRTPAPLTGPPTTSMVDFTWSDLDDELSPIEDPLPIASSSRSKQSLSLSTDKPKKRGRPPLHKKPITPAPVSNSPPPVTPSPSKAEAPVATPSLKIRLPRLNMLSFPSIAPDDAPSASAPPTSQPPKRGRGRPRKHPVDRPPGPGRPRKGGPRRVERHASSTRTSVTEAPLSNTQTSLP